MDKKIIHSVFEHIVTQYPHQTAIEYNNKNLTYQALNQQANQLAHTLRTQGVGRDHIVGLFLPAGMDYVVSLLAVAKAGGVFLPLDTASPKKRLEYLLNKAKPNIIITDSESKADLAQNLTEFNLNHQISTVLLSDAAQASTANPELLSNAEDSLYLLFTSGSTGNPKAIVGRQKSLSHFIHWEMKEFGFDIQVRVSLLAAPTFDVSLRDIFVPLLAGGTLCIPDTDTRTNMAHLLDWFNRSRVTTVHCVPSLFRLISKELENSPTPQQALPALKTILLAGEPVYGSLVNQWFNQMGQGIALVNLYGPSETTLAKAFHRIEYKTYEPHAIVPIGQPIGNTALLLLKNNQLCAVGDIGEIHIKTPFLSKGYYQDEALTAASFIQNPLNEQTDIIYKTGDLGRYLPDRSVEFLGRLDNQVKVNGIRIELGEIEQAVLRHASINQAVAIVHKASPDNQILVCYYTTKQALSSDDLRHHLQHYLANNMIPPFLVELDTFKLNLHGKIDRKALPKPEALLYERIPYQAPSNETEEKLAAIWGEVLGLQTVGVNNAFIDLGGDSLKAIRVVAKIYQSFEVEISLKNYFNYPTIAQLAQFINTQQKTTYQAIPNVAQQDHYAVSHAQKRLWTLQQMDIDARAYNLPSAYLFQGDYDVAALQNAFQYLVDRHESLRTGFIEVDGAVKQHIVEQVTFKLTVIDIRSEADQTTLIQNHIEQNRLQAFDLIQAPLLRVTLLQLAADQYLFIFNIHHIICDVWSLNILMQELLQCYQDLAAGKTPNLPPLAIQYKDYAAWQNNLLQDDSTQTHQTYWQQKLAAPLPQLDLPTDFPRPSVQTFKGNTLHFQLDASLTAALNALSQRHQVSLFMTLLALVRVLLYRYTGEEDIIIGSPIAGRQHPDLEPQVGFYVNMLALRDSAVGSDTFIDVLQRVQHTTLEAYDHQFYPFDRLVDELQLERDMSRSPLFDVMVMLQNVDVAAVNLESLRITPYGEEGESDVSRFDWVVHFSERDGGLRVDFNYNIALFTAERIRRAFGHLEQLMHSVCSDAQQPIQSLTLLSAQEREQVLTGFNQRSLAYPSDKTLVELFEAQVAQRPDHPAVMLNGQSWSYQAINTAANCVAHNLRQHPALSPQAIVGVSINRSEYLVMALLGVLKAGGVYLPIDPNYPPTRISHMLNNSGCQIVLADQAHSETMQAYDGIAVLEISTLTQQGTTDNLESSNSLDDMAFVIYTSGSTGQPKGVMMPQRGFINMIFDQIEHFAITPHDRLLQFASASFDAALYESFIAFLSGATLVLIDKSTIDNTSQFVDYLQQHAVTTVVLPPVYLRALQQHPLPSVRNIMTVGEAAIIEDALYYAQNKQYFNGYGPSEGSICVSVHRVDAKQSYPNGLPIGRPTANTALYILDAHMSPLPIGISGEICVAGVAVTQGYLNNPELTQASFMANPFNPSERLYKTGDLGRWLSNGEIEFIGRQDTQVKVSGHRIEPGEVALALRQHPAVQDALVLAHGQATGDKTLVAYFTTSVDATAPNSTGLRAFLHQQLPTYMVPAYFVALAQLPLTPNGKIDKAALPSLDTIRAQQTEHYVAPQTELETLLAAAWTAFLGQATISVHDNYFALGGDSIKAIQIAAHLRQAGYRLEVHDIFQYPTIAQLALEIVPLQQQLDQNVMTGEVPLTPIQHWFFSQQWPEPWHFNQSVLLHIPADWSPDALKQAFATLLSHHDALRLRYQQVNGQWQQSVSAITETIPFHIEDLSAVDNPIAALEPFTLQYQRALNLTDGPLTHMVLLTWQGQARLFWCIHHLVVDGVSWRILLADLQQAYQAIIANQTPQLPLKTSHYKVWSERLAEYAHSEALAAALPYWQALPTLALPLDYADGENHLAYVQTHTLSLSQADTNALLKQVPIAYNTRINDVLLTALALTLTEWSGNNQCVIELEGHGRVALFKDINLSRTVGWFTTTHPVALTVSRAADLGATLKTVKEQLRSVPHDGIGHGLLSQLGNALPKGEVLFNYQGQFDAEDDSSDFHLANETTGSDVSLSGQRHYLIDINGAIVGGQLSLTWGYSSACYQATTIQRLTERYQHHLHNLIRHCRHGKQGVTPSDFPLASVSQTTLDALYSQCHDLQDLYPLSPMQQGMVFHALYEPETGVYFEQNQWTLSQLDPAAFKAAWQYQLDRHPIFRSAFLTNHNPILQWVQAHVALPWREHDWRNQPAAQQQAQLQQLLEQERQQGFDLSQAPLMRFDLIRIDEQGYIFLHHHHHVLMDGWCLPIIFHELRHSYVAFKQGTTPNLATLRPYRDYIAWLQQQDQAAAQHYWQQRLAGLSAPTNLPLLGHKTDQPSYHIHHAALSNADSQRLQQFSQTQGITLNTLIQGVWGLLLRRYSREDAVCFGVTISGRQAPLSGIENMLGLFINTLPLYVSSQQPTVKDYLLAIQTQHQNDSRYAHTPLVEIQRCSEVPNGTALFDSLLIFENYPAGKALEPVANCFQVDAFAGIEYTNYPLTVVIIPDDALSFKISYDAHRINSTAIEQLWGHLTTLLMAVMDDPTQAIPQLPMLTAAEQQQLQAWNNTAADYPPTQTVVDLFEQQVAQTPEQIAVVLLSSEAEQNHPATAQTTLTYQQLNTQANRLAHQLLDLQQQMALPANPLIAIAVERSLDMLIGLLGILKAGGAYVPIDPSYPDARIAHMLTDSAAPIVLTQSSLQSHLPATNAQVLCLDTLDFSAQNAANPSVPIQAQDLAYVIYTSGSTGKPKGVMVKQYGLLNFLLDMQQRTGLSVDDKLLAVTTLSFDIAALELYLPLISGSCLHLASQAIASDGLSLQQHLTQHAITFMQATPATWQMLKHSHWHPATPLNILCGGEALLPDLANYLLEHSQNLWNVYGPTETTIWSTAYPIQNKLSHYPAIGRPIANTRIYILDAHHQLQPPGIPGELCIAGAGLARGYLNRPELSAEKFIEIDLFGQTERIYKTGDLARWLPDGNLEYLSRIDHQIKLRGFRIELGEIEVVLSQHEAVKDNALVVQQTGNDKRLIAYITVHDALNAEHGVFITALRDWLKTRLPDYMVPSHIVILDKLPLTPNGKINRKVLEKRANEENLVVASLDYVAPRNAEEERIAHIWADTLGLEKVGIHDDFFTLGGHSLLATQVISRIRDQLKVNLPIKTLFQYPTLAEFAAQCSHDPSQMGFIPISQAQLSEQTRFSISLTELELWFMQQLYPDAASMYYLSLASCLNGPLNLSWLKHSLQHLVQSHAVLRSGFTRENDSIVRIIQDDIALPFEVIDLRQYPVAERETKAQQQLNAYMEQALPFPQGPLWRCVLWQISDTQHWLLFVIHHIISDGWSLSLIAQKIAEHYRSLEQGLPLPSTEHALSYPQYAAWQTHYFNSEQAQAQRDYWCHVLRDLPPPLVFPNHRYPNQRQFDGHIHPIQIAPDLVDKLQALSRQNRSTLFVTLLSGFKLLLAAYTQRQDLIVGTPLASRTQAEFENDLGFFANTLPIRTNLSGNPSGRELLKRVNDSSIGVIAHQQTPFVKVLEWAQPQRAVGQAQLHQVLFALQNTPEIKLEFSEHISVAALPFTETEHAVEFDMFLSLEESDAGVVGTLLYRSDVFESAWIQQYCMDYQALLHALVANPDANMDTLLSYIDTKPTQTTPSVQTMPATAVVAPQTALEQKLHHLWETVLNNAVSSVHDDFFALGGSSLQLLALLNQIEQTLHCALPVQALFTHSTIQQQSVLLSEYTGDAS